jgi:hypothetical protein
VERPELLDFDRSAPAPGSIETFPSLLCRSPPHVPVGASSPPEDEPLSGGAFSLARAASSAARAAALLALGCLFLRFALRFARFRCDASASSSSAWKVNDHVSSGLESTTRLPLQTGENRVATSISLWHDAMVPSFCLRAAKRCMSNDLGRSAG